MIDKEAAQNLALLKGLGYSQKSIAEHIGVSEPMVSMVLHGRVATPPEMAEKIKSMLVEHDAGDVEPDGAQTRNVRASAINSHLQDSIVQAVHSYTEQSAVNKFILLMQWLKIPQVVVAQHLGVPAQYLSNYMSGRMKVNDRVYVKVYEVLDEMFPDETPDYIKAVVQDIKAMYG